VHSAFISTTVSPYQVRLLPRPFGALTVVTCHPLVVHRGCRPYLHRSTLVAGHLSSGSHLSTYCPPQSRIPPPRHSSSTRVPTRPSTTVSMASAEHSIHLGDASQRPWTRGGANGGPSKDQPPLWRCWVQTGVTFRTGSGFSAGR